MNGNGMKEDTMGRNRFLVTESRELDDELIAAEDADGARMEPVPSVRPRHAPTRDEMAAAARTLVDAKTAALGTVPFAAMVDDLIPDGRTPQTSTRTAGECLQIGRTTTQNSSEPVLHRPKPRLAHPEGEAHEERDEGVYDPGGDVDAARDPNAPEGDDWRTRGQFGARAPDTYYRNLPAFVEGFAGARVLVPPVHELASTGGWPTGGGGRSSSSRWTRCGAPTRRPAANPTA